MFPAARIGDPVTHDLNVPSGVTGPPVVPPPPELGVVLIEGMVAAHVQCTVICSGATSLGPAHPPPPPGVPPSPIMVGSPTVLIHQLPAARWAPSGDVTACAAQLGDPKLTAGRTVLIGGPRLPPGMPLRPGENGELLFGNSIAIVGPDLSKMLILNRLLRIGDTKSGQALFAQMEITGKKATIELYDEDNSEAYPLDWQAATRAGKPVFHGTGGPVEGADGKQLMGTGLGSDSQVKLNPGLTLENELAPDKPMPNDAILFHELTHSKHQMSGTNDCTPKGKHWTTQEEKNTIREDHPSEADYLKERGYKWHRTSHGETFARNHE